MMNNMNIPPSRNDTGLAPGMRLAANFVLILAESIYLLNLLWARQKLRLQIPKLVRKAWGLPKEVKLWYSDGSTQRAMAKKQGGNNGDVDYTSAKAADLDRKWPEVFELPYFPNLGIPEVGGVFLFRFDH